MGADNALANCVVYLKSVGSGKDWPKEMQGGFIKVRYKPTNKVEIHEWIEKDDHFEEKFVSDVQNLFFRQCCINSH